MYDLTIILILKCINKMSVTIILIIKHATFYFILLIFSKIINVLHTIFFIKRSNNLICPQQFRKKMKSARIVENTTQHEKKRKFPNLSDDSAISLNAPRWQQDIL